MELLLALLALLSVDAASAQLSCKAGYQYGIDTALVTIPYTASLPAPPQPASPANPPQYDQVLSIIGQFGNLTWSGSPPGSVSLNGPDDTVGTTRTYNIDGAHVEETLTVYDKPAYPGPYYESHVLHPVVLPLPSGNITVYSPADATTVTPVCDGKASFFNFTIPFCATNAAVAAATLHSIHSTDGLTVGKFLGGVNFTSCAALGGGVPTPTAPPPALYTGAAPSMRGETWVGYAAAGTGAVVMAWLIGA